MGDNKTLPFHEVLPSLINEASHSDLMLLVGIIKKTRIPSNHDEIAKLWVKRCRELQMGLSLEEIRKVHGGISVWATVEPPYFGVPEALREQKAFSEAEDSKHSGRNFRVPVGP